MINKEDKGKEVIYMEEKNETIPQGETAAQEEAPSLKKEILSWVRFFAGILIVVLILNYGILVNAYVPSGSMMETIQPGDRLFGLRLIYKFSDPKRFDIVVFHFPDNEKEIYIKRIIGLPGDTVNIVDGKVYINDSTEPLDDSFIKEPMNGSYGPFNVPENCYFMLGDNRNGSADSRFWMNPYVSKDKIIGKAYVRYWPVTKMKSLY